MPGIYDDASKQSPAGLLDLLSQTWPARMASGLLGGVMAPGDAWNGNLQMTGPDGHSSPEAITRAANLASLLTMGSGAVPAGASELRAGIRPYQNVPDSLMGFSRNGPQKGFNETNYPLEQSVKVVFGKNDIYNDVIKGMNPDHAVERAYRNWPDAMHIMAILGLK